MPELRSRDPRRPAGDAGRAIDPNHRILSAWRIVGNPEQMDEFKVHRLIIDCRDALLAAKAIERPGCARRPLRCGI